jgi:hypothetical protein
VGKATQYEAGTNGGGDGGEPRFHGFEEVGLRPSTMPWPYEYLMRLNLVLCNQFFCVADAELCDKRGKSRLARLAGLISSVIEKNPRINRLGRFRLTGFVDGVKIDPSGMAMSHSNGWRSWCGFMLHPICAHDNERLTLEI